MKRWQCVYVCIGGLEMGTDVLKVSTWKLFIEAVRRETLSGDKWACQFDRDEEFKLIN